MNDNGKSRFWIDEFGMVREGVRFCEQTNKTGGDNLWRTGLGYVAWGFDELKNGIISCFEFDSDNKKITTIYRSANKVGSEDCSRDQVIMALAALKIRGNGDDLTKIVNASKFRISPKFLHTIDSWCWMKDLVGKCYFPIHLFTIIWYSLLSMISRLNIFHVFGIGSARFPSYAQHLACWQLYTSNNWFGLKWIASKFMLMSIERQNLLCRLLCNDKTISEWEFTNITYLTDFQWQRWISDTNHKLNMGEGLRPLTNDEMSQYLLPKDIISYLIMRNKIF
jgi:hypothetical protein